MHEYIEKTEFNLLRVEDDGEIRFSNINVFSEEVIKTLIEKSKDNNIGLYLKNGFLWKVKHSRITIGERKNIWKYGVRLIILSWL